MLIDLSSCNWRLVVFNTMLRRIRRIRRIIVTSKCISDNCESGVVHRISDNCESGVVHGVV